MSQPNRAVIVMKKSKAAAVGSGTESGRAHGPLFDAASVYKFDLASVYKLVPLTPSLLITPPLTDQSYGAKLDVSEVGSPASLR